MDEDTPTFADALSVREARQLVRNLATAAKQERLAFTTIAELLRISDDIIQEVTFEEFMDIVAVRTTAVAKRAGIKDFQWPHN
jgi:predicted XRE-type DNA-binding protein